MNTNNHHRTSRFENLLEKIDTNRIIIKFIITQDQFEEVNKLVAIPVRPRNEQSLLVKQSVQALKYGKNYHETRADNAGNIRRDSGKEIFKSGSMWGADLLESVIQNFGNWGTQVCAYQKEGDPRYFLQVILTEKETEVGDKSSINAAQMIANNVFQYVNVFRNADGTATFNFSNILPNAQKRLSMRLTEEKQIEKLTY